ncbi:MAG TPA: ZIP family metal transporter [Thermotogota bacterium]|jgi:ZIP family zinc transporter|nr:ZIP family metal transporter [Thermotogota bacterium]OQC32901.1 MAG: Zinc transporter ZupT [Thermotogota bacterium ADurb.Bin062]HNW46068.1 ZIP family metal transporter [Thermotogota bacterium]HNY82723.1 ZIP family metal transporter [Thermotogota bacterium]HOD91965.1 ZIP family metal transporter [Thermotogota bacterium]
MNLALYGIVLSTVAGLTTALGALPFFFFRKRTDERVIDALLGFASGVMLAASAFSLVQPSIEAGGLWRFLVGFGLGALAVDLIDHFAPHEHFLKGYEGPDRKKVSRIWLFVMAITIHNFPEGMAVGVGAFTKDALAIAVAIGAQNIPEGAAVAAALINAKYSPGKAFLVTLLTGVVEVVGGLLGVTIISFSQALLPYMMAFAAGAMIFVIGDEVIPESHLNGHQRLATYSLIIGFFIMSALDVALG